MKPAEDELHCGSRRCDQRQGYRRPGSVTSRSWTFLPRFLAAKSARAIRAAKARTEARQHWKPGRAPGAQPGTMAARPRQLRCRTRAIGSYKREFGVPDGRDRSFTRSGQRIMKHAGGGSEQSYNGYTAVDAEHQIIGWRRVDQLRRGRSGARWACWQQFRPAPEKCRPRRWRMRDSVVGCSGKVADHHGDVIVALGREGREDAKVNAKTHPHTAAIAAGKLKTEQGSGLPPAQVDRGGSNGWIKGGDGIASVQHRGTWTRCKPSGLVCMALNLRRMAYL